MPLLIIPAPAVTPVASLIRLNHPVVRFFDQATHSTVADTRESATMQTKGLGGEELRSYAVGALGYLGGLLVVGAAVLVVNRYWSDLETAGS